VRWEYKEIGGVNLENTLNALGHEGWEIAMAQCVDYTPAVREGSGMVLRPPAYHLVVLLKRSAGLIPQLKVFPAATAITAFLGRVPQGPVNTPVTTQSFAQFEAEFGGLSADCPLTYAVRQYFENGGEEALIVGVEGSGPGGAALDDDIAGPARQAAGEGLWALDKAAGFNLLCIPPLTRTRDVAPATWATALSYCTPRQAVLLVDPPATWTSVTDLEASNALLETLGGQDAANGALYFPRLRAPDPLSGNAVESFAPCGAVAGTLARLDSERGVWSAPAGAVASLRGITGVEVQLGAEELTRLAGMGVNPIRITSGETLLWGAHTLAGKSSKDTEWRYVSIRRFALYLETSLRNTLTAAAFETIKPTLCSEVRTAVETFLLALFRQGAFPGHTPDEAFFVRCGPETMTQNDIDNGRLIVEVGVAPVRPAEFIILRIGQFTRS
jgi:hypothetical protein